MDKRSYLKFVKTIFQEFITAFYWPKEAVPMLNTSCKLKEMAYGIQDYLTSLRREFHSHPELSSEEFGTRQIIIRELEAHGIPYVKVDGTGIVAILKGGKPGKNRMIRADIDALPLQEEPENLKGKKICISQVPGKCHACGHDGHMAMLLGTLKLLKQLQAEVPGTVYAAFEEGEEATTGVAKMLKALEPYPIEECFALHVYAGLGSGKISIAPGPRMAGTVGIGFSVKGKAGHGSRPDQARNPIIPAAHILTEINSAFLNQLDPEETTTLGICQFQAGTTSNIIPDSAYIAGTARYFNKAEGEKALEIITRTAQQVAAIHQCQVEFADRHKISLLPVVNDPQVARRVADGVRQICGESALEDCGKWYASESFSEYMEKYPGALGLLGIRNEALGTGAPHHNGKFDLDESALPLGVCAELSFVCND